MITKTVTSGQRSATATISEETKFIFSDAWNYFHVQNLGSGTVYISMSAGTAAGADGVIAIPAGGTACTMHGYPVNDVYVTSTASDMVQIIGANSATLPFKFGSTGGGGGSSYILPKASLNALGGIQAKAKTTESAEAAIGADNKLYVKVPVALSELTNDAEFIKATADNLTNYYNKANSYSKAEINTLINDLNSLSAEIVAALPTENISTTTIYLIQVPSTNNYNQYMYISNAWANLGTTQIDLTNYYTKAEADTLLTGKADTSHTHTTVNGHTVESDVPANAKFTDTTYSAATTSADGLMSSADKAKLDGIDVTNITSLINDKQSLPIVRDYTLSSANWVGTEEPYTYTLEVLNTDSNDIIDVSTQNSATYTQVQDISNAKIYQIIQSENTLTFKAGVLPTSDLLISVVIWKR